jgi:hypothetical protein
MSLVEATGQAPRRMAIVNLATGETVEAPFNPEDLEEAVEVLYARQPVRGLSHQPLQYGSTGNVTFQFELRFLVTSPAAAKSLSSVRRFLQSLCYPGWSAESVVTGGPPRCLFVWPGLVSLTCVVTQLGLHYTRFRPDGVPIEMAARLALEEIRDTRLFSEDVRIAGSLRGGENEDLE